MLWVYRLLFLPALLFSAPFYLARMRRRGGYRRHFGHRFGAIPALAPPGPGGLRVWIQAVSVGEMLAIAPLLEALRRDPQVQVYLTTTTSTGFKLARERYGECAAAIGYFPLDWWLFSARAWSRVKPDLVILTEGERWPEHVHQAARRGIPVLCVNARLSDRSFRRMKAWRWAARPLLNGISHLLAASEMDAQRFVELGFPRSAVDVTGNIKLDLQLPVLSADEQARLRTELGFGPEPIVIGSSTWPGEEEALLQAWRKLQGMGVECRLLLVPRHAERRGELEAWLATEQVPFHFRSRGPAPAPVSVAVADTTGELRRLLQLAEVVFVGKSLPPHDQGQTPVEAAALGKPILAGPGMTNFRAIASELSRAGALRTVADSAELTEVLVELFRDADRRSAMSRAALSWHRANRGALDRTVRHLSEALQAVRLKRAAIQERR